eukprot:15445390-Alexandrium_andersonii.AAC.2
MPPSASARSPSLDYGPPGKDCRASEPFVSGRSSRARIAALRGGARRIWQSPTYTGNDTVAPEEFGSGEEREYGAPESWRRQCGSQRPHLRIPRIALLGVQSSGSHGRNPRLAPPDSGREPPCQSFRIRRAMPPGLRPAAGFNARAEPPRRDSQAQMVEPPPSAHCAPGFRACLLYTSDAADDM